MKRRILCIVLMISMLLCQISAYAEGYACGNVNRAAKVICVGNSDKNNLYYMRSRYYNINIKRFINQDIITGSITNSQSLNRYSYVQGNPVTLTDPFGLSPYANISWKSLGHAVMSGLGLIPHPLFQVCDVANMVWYISDHDYKNAVLSGICALPLIGDALGAGLNAMKLGRADKIIKTSTRFISCAATFTQTAGNTIAGMREVYNNAKNGQFFSMKNAGDMAGVVVNAALTFLSGKATYKYGKDLDVLLTGDGKTVWSGIKSSIKKAGNSVKSHVVAFHQNNGGYLNLGGNESKVYYHVTTTENAQKIIQSGELKNGQWESNVFVWNQQPTKKQASIAGIGSNSQTVLKFETSASFTKDIGNKNKAISDIVMQSSEGEKLPISIENIEIVGFKKEWWQIWKK